jgi:hypothetical protein
MEKIKELLIKIYKNPIISFTIIVLLILSFKGTSNYITDFKNYIFLQELDKRGLELEKQEFNLIVDKNKLDSTILEQTKEIKKVDYQEIVKQDKNAEIKKSFQKRGIKITDADIDALWKQDKLLPKYSNK